jgi:hypothetical protein
MSLKLLLCSDLYTIKCPKCWKKHTFMFFNKGWCDVCFEEFSNSLGISDGTERCSTSVINLFEQKKIRIKWHLKKDYNK